MVEVERYRVRRVDQHNWCIEKKTVVESGKHEGDVAWRGSKFYPRLEQALLALVDLVGNEAGKTHGIETAVKTIVAAKEEILAAVARMEDKNAR